VPVQVRSDVPEQENFRTALRAALLPTGVYLLVLVPAKILFFVTADAQGRVPPLIEWISFLTGLFGLCMAGWAGYRAAIWARRGRWALLAGLLVGAMSDLLLLPIRCLRRRGRWVREEASRHPTL